MLKMIIFSFRKYQNNRKNPSEIIIFRLKSIDIGIFLFQKNDLSLFFYSEINIEMKITSSLKTKPL